MSNNKKIDRPDRANTGSPARQIDRGENPAEQGWAQRSIVRIEYDLCADTVFVRWSARDVFEFKNGQSHVVKDMPARICWICVENCSREPSR